MGFRIKQYAYGQGMKLGDLARKLRMPLSNLSAIASGRRSVSLGLLRKVACLLNCSLAELFEEVPAPAVFQSVVVEKKIRQIESANSIGREKGWLHHVMIARQHHYRTARSRMGGRHE